MHNNIQKIFAKKYTVRNVPAVHFLFECLLLKFVGQGLAPAEIFYAFLTTKTSQPFSSKRSITSKPFSAKE